MYASRIDKVSSVDPPSTTMCSKSVKVCSRRLSSVARRYFPVLYEGVTMLMVGGMEDIIASAESRRISQDRSFIASSRRGWCQMYFTH